MSIALKSARLVASRRNNAIAVMMELSYLDRANASQGAHRNIRRIISKKSVLRSGRWPFLFPLVLSWLYVL